MPELQEILKKIEELRANLNKMTDRRKMTDPEVLYASQMLDTALNEYQRLMKDKANRS